MLNWLVAGGLLSGAYLLGYVTRALLERADIGQPAPVPYPAPPAGTPVLYGRPNVAKQSARYLVWDKDAGRHVVKEIRS